MTPIEQVYHRVRRDPGLDASRFVIGYDARRAAPVEVPFADFTPGGDIPWHRVLYLAADGEVVWDRRAKIDRLGQTEAGRASRPRVLPEPLFTPRAAHRFDAEAERWVPVETGSVEAERGLERLRVVTWNVLFDRYETERIETERRRPLLLRELEAQDADVIALQEVEKPFLKALLAEPWVRARYLVSDAPSGKSVDPYGVVLLSRVPVLELGAHALGRHKQIVAMVLAAGARPRVVATCHLTSDHAARGADKRQAQLAVLREMLDGLGGADALVVGDLNEHGDLPATALGARDLWTELVGDDAPTFDPVENPLAAISSLRGEALRLDRVLARVGADVRPLRIERVGTEPSPGGLFPSDHYGLAAELALDVAAPQRACGAATTAGTLGSGSAASFGPRSCPTGTVASGFFVRSGRIIDDLGLRCALPAWFP
jgi:poly(A) polymerase